jgi:hypothetical protein
MDSISIISLKPEFSRVFRATETSKLFQRLLVKRKAVETADYSLGALSTWLKSGVGESRTFLWN